MTTRTKDRTSNGWVRYTYTNECGAIVVDRVLMMRSGFNGWRVRLYTAPDEWNAYYGLDADDAEERCGGHASVMA